MQVANRDLLCPVILFIDKTHIDSKLRLTLEPVTFTLGIFTKEVRKRVPTLVDPWVTFLISITFLQRVHPGKLMIIIMSFPLYWTRFEKRSIPMVFTGR